ncbi:MAG: FGGY family carbohydrate kinase [Pseudomonadota bacterium]
MAAELVLAIDMGTSSTRSMLFDMRGRPLPASLAQRRYAPDSDASGKFELRPARVLESTRQCLDETLAWHQQRRPRARIAAVATSCFWHSLIGTDARARPTTAIITWADTRAAADATRLSTELDARAYHAATGCMLHASFWPAKLRWLNARMPRLVAQTCFWMSPGEWVLWKLTGRRQCAHGMATGTGLYAPTRLEWDEQFFSVSGIETEQLNPLSDTPFGSGGRAAKRWPALAGACWFPAVGDGITSNLGCGATDYRYAALNYGTSAALRIVKRGRKASAPYGLFAYRIDRRRYLLGGAISNAGSLHAWSLDRLRIAAAGKRYEHEIANRIRTGHGLTVLPFFNGERAPHWRDDLSATIAGLRQSTTALDIAAALREASFHRLAMIAERIPGMRARTAIVGGGLTPSALQTLADVTGLKLRRAPIGEASLRGAAMLAIEHLGCSWPELPEGKVYEPNRRSVREFRARRAAQRELEERMGAPGLP